jgi:hypothetical protein
MGTNRRKIARSFVPLSTRLRPLRSLDEAILLGLLRATDAVDSRPIADRHAMAMGVSQRWLPAQPGATAGDMPSAAETERESVGHAVGSGGTSR